MMLWGTGLPWYRGSSVLRCRCRGGEEGLGVVQHRRNLNIVLLMMICYCNDSLSKSLVFEPVSAKG